LLFTVCPESNSSPTVINSPNITIFRLSQWSVAQIVQVVEIVQTVEVVEIVYIVRGVIRYLLYVIRKRSAYNSLFSDF
jgi:hypothetical protein